MAASGSVFSKTLQDITSTKLEELSKRRAAYEAERAAVLDSIREKQDPVERLHALSSGVRRCLSISTDQDGKVVKGWSKYPAAEVEIKNLDRFLAQAGCDPSISAKTFKKWEDSLLRHLDAQSLKFAYASLYGELVTEWLTSESSDGAADSGDVDMKEDFETIDNAKKLEARMEWEKMVFEPAELDVGKLQTYLNNLFGVGDPQRRPLFQSLVRLREEVKEFERGFRITNQFTPSSLRWVIRGLIRSDLLTDEKREVLKDFNTNEIILAEVADVLNMRMASIGTWSWGSSVPLEQRRKITGAFSIHMHEDLLQAIFIHYIGVKLSIFFKRVFLQFRRTREAWISNRRDIPLAERNKMEYYLGPMNAPDTVDVQALRRREYRKNYFMSQLVRSENQPVESMEGDEEADYAPVAMARKQAIQSQAQQQQVAPQQSSNHALQNHQMQLMMLEQQNKKRVMMARAEQPHFSVKRPRLNEYHSDGDDDDSETDDDDEVLPRRPMAMKKRLLHLLSTEITINTTLHGELTAFHSMFNNLYSLFPHQTIEHIVVLFGFSETWRKFFQSYLEAPLKFLDDDESTPARTRRRGTPGSHALSEVFGEVTLFVLDFAVNQTTTGSFLWRLHDDFWFWSPDQKLCVKAWKAVTEFAEATGTNINYTKTGTVRIVKDAKVAPKVDPSLPEGEIRWGFLHLSSEKGHFAIDQEIVDIHIAELRKQLTERKKSVFDFVQTWNIYEATFFTSNFGKPANCFGRGHVDDMLATHERIQREIFSSNPSLGLGSEKSSNIVEYLKNTLEERFGVTDIPDGYLFFPVELGGLDLQSPFISLLQIRDSLLQSSDPLLAQLQESEKEAYLKARKTFETGAIKQARRDVRDPRWEPTTQRDRETFISFEDFVKYREEWNMNHGTQVHDVYLRLLEEPVQESIEIDGAMMSDGIVPLAPQTNLRGILGNWGGMQPYWKWVTMLYGPEVLDRFGGLNIVDPGMLPMGMVRLFREKRVKWQT
jgi:hypothetical protein